MQFLRQCIGLRSPLRVIYHWCRWVLAFSLSGNPAKGMYIIRWPVLKENHHFDTHSQCSRKSGRPVAWSPRLKSGSHEKHENQSKMTMDSPFKLWRRSNKQKNGVTHLVLETSSHGIYYFRNFGIRYDAVVLTNISQDHLDLHGTMDHYNKDKGAPIQIWNPQNLRPPTRLWVLCHLCKKSWNQSWSPTACRLRRPIRHVHLSRIRRA